MTCPPFTELCAADAPTAVHEHLSACPRCRAIVSRIEASEPAIELSTSAGTARTATPPPTPGGVWTFCAPTMDEYVVGAILEVDAEDVLIVPLLTETTWAADADLVLAPDVLGYAAVATLWASDHVLREQAVEAVDVLSEQDLDRLMAGYDAFYAGEPVGEAAGPPVLTDQDPRLAAHAALADDLHPLYRPWALLQVADELGPVLAQRRAEVGVELDSLSTEIDIAPQAWSAFELGEGDPFHTIPVRAMGRALRALGVMESRRVIELARASVDAHHVADSLTGAPAKARRRRGTVARNRRDPEAARLAADQYADALAKELGL